MPVQRRLLSLVAVGSIVASLAATRSAATAPCALLTAAEASTALGVTSLPGKEFSGPTTCAWSNDSKLSDTSRRVMLVTHSVMAFNIAKRPAIATIKVVPVSGIGDEAFYQVYPKGQNVFIWVKKGAGTFSINIMTRRDPRPFTDEQEEAKDAVLAKAAVGRM